MNEVRMLTLMGHIREEYLAEWRLGTMQTLENLYIDDGKGNVRKLDKKN